MHHDPLSTSTHDATTFKALISRQLDQLMQ
jgi:hypothetical protein